MKILDAIYVYKLGQGEKLMWHGRYHSHKENEFEIHYFVDGEGSFLSNKARFSITKNALFLSVPHEFHSIVPQLVKQPLTYYAILFSLDEADVTLFSLLESVLSGGKKCFYNNIVDTFVLNEIINLSLSPKIMEKTSANYLLSSYLFRWFGDICEKNSIFALEDNAESKKSKEYVRKAINLMKDSIENPSALEDIAWKLNLSTEHFIRIFKAETDITPHQYWLRLRVQTASTRLITSDKSIGLIAKEFAFENQFHFSSVFKKCTGLTPSAYREIYKKPNDE